MPSLTPLTEGVETLDALAEGTETLTALAEGAETLTALVEGVAVPDVTNPGLYPSVSTFPSAALTYPSLGSFVAGSGLQMDTLAEGTETLTPIAEA